MKLGKNTSLGHKRKNGRQKWEMYLSQKVDVHILQGNFFSKKKRRKSRKILVRMNDHVSEAKQPQGRNKDTKVVLL